MLPDDIGSKSVALQKIGNVLTIRIDREDVRNAVDLDVHVGIGTALAHADKDSSIRAIVITGTGNNAFCAGADLKAIARGERLLPEDPVQYGWGFAGYTRHAVSKPTIAAVNGVALGGGTEIALASDLVVASENATFGLPEVKRGIIAGAGGTFRLAAQIPLKAAMEILLTGDPISARRALDLGLINAVVPVGHAMEAAMALAERVAANAPLSVQASKRIALGIVDGAIAREEDAWALSHEEGQAVFLSEDAREGVRAFAERRPPNWKAR